MALTFFDTHCPPMIGAAIMKLKIIRITIWIC